MYLTVFSPVLLVIKNMNVFFLICALTSSCQYLDAMMPKTKKHRIDNTQDGKTLELFPKSLEGSAVEVLDLSGCDLSFDLSYTVKIEGENYAHPLRVLCDLHKTHTLRLNACNISELPNEIGNLQELRSLSLNLNPITMLNPCIVGLKLSYLSILGTPPRQGESAPSEALVLYRLMGGTQFSQRAHRLHLCLERLNSEAAEKLVDPQLTELKNALLACKSFDMLQVARLYMENPQDFPERLHAYDNLYEEITDLEKELRYFQVNLLTEIERDVQRNTNGQCEEDESSWDSWHDGDDRHERLERLVLSVPPNEVLRQYERSPENMWSEDTKDAYNEAKAFEDLVQVLDELECHLSYLFWLGALIFENKLQYNFTLGTSQLPRDLLLTLATRYL